MKHDMGRRCFLKTTGMAAAGMALCGLGNRKVFASKPVPKGAPHAEQLGWLLGCQAYSFRKFSFFEAIEKTASLGLTYIEAYPKQKIDKDKKVRMGVGLDKNQRREIKRRLDDAGVKLINYGCCPLVKDEAESRKTFDFAKEMGVKTLVAEPPKAAFDTLEKLCDEYEINLAIHNHPHRPGSMYWDYRTVLEVCKDRSKRIGACCDTGHWMRSNIWPIEAIKALEGRIISLHLKDLDAFNKPKAHDVPWGTGKGHVHDVLNELLRQKFKGFFAIEYERGGPKLLENMGKCVRYFDDSAVKLQIYDPPRVES